ncbi:hypothetical protein FQA39_LY13112 [Lamprigera yunnana]|nr:hypothetical protein FQA39_LY13112 [Lamprigera yunnana]
MLNNAIGYEIYLVRMAYFKVRDTHWEVITSFMENHPSFASGRLNCASGRATYNSLWESLTNELNALGVGPRELKNLTDVEEKILQLLSSSFFMDTDIPERCGSAIQKQLMAGKQQQGSCASGLQLTAITSPGVSDNNRSLRLTATSFSNYSEVLKLSTAAGRNSLDNTRLIELPNQSSTIVSALSCLTPTKRNRSPTVSNLQECCIKNAYEQPRDEEPHAAQNGVDD